MERKRKRRETMTNKWCPSKFIDDGDLVVRCWLFVGVPAGGLKEGHCLSRYTKMSFFNCTLSSAVKYTCMSVALCVYLLDTKLWVLRLGSSLPQSKSLQQPLLKCPVSVGTRKAHSQSASPLNLWPYSFVPESIIDCLLTFVTLLYCSFFGYFPLFKNF